MKIFRLYFSQSARLFGCMMLSLGLTACLKHEVSEPRQGDYQQAAKYHTRLAMGYLQQGDSPRAKGHLLVAMRFAPRSPDVNAAMGYFLEHIHEQELAQNYYKRALMLAPHSGAQKNNYGAFLCRQGYHAQAMSLLLEAAKDLHYDNTSLAYENAGLCAEMMHHYRQSMVYFSKALRQDNRLEVALQEYVKLARLTGKPQKAEAMLRRCKRRSLL